MVITVLLALGVLALFAVAVARPWHGLLVLLCLLPLNGFLTLVVPDVFGLTSFNSIEIAAWHDALAGGVIVAAAWELVRRGRGARPRVGVVEALAAVVLILGGVFVLVAPYRLTAVYAYRTLYEPVVLMLAITVLAWCRGLPVGLLNRAGLAMAAGGVVAALAAWPQVYVGGFGYLDTYYHASGERLSPSYLATGLAQPRAVGTFNSPNEFAAYLSIVVAILVLPGVVRLSPRLRAWMLVPVILALLLSFSRSGWVATSTALVVGGLLLARERGMPSVQRIRAALARGVREVWPQLGVLLVLLVVVVLSSRAASFVSSTVTGNDPSAAARPSSAAQGVKDIAANPLGVGLGMAGPKSTRFGEPGPQPVLASETWYVTYGIQVGVEGLLVLVALVVAMLREVVPRPRGPWRTFAVAVTIGLLVGALFIPVLDDPSVFVPLWAVLGLALAVARSAAPGRQTAARAAA